MLHKISQPFFGPLSMKKIILVLSCILVLSTHAQIFKCTDTNGNIIFQGHACKNVKQKQEQIDASGRKIIDESIVNETVDSKKKKTRKSRTRKSTGGSKTLSQSSLQGKWLMTEFMGAPVGEEFGLEYWIFNGNKYTYISGRDKDKPVSYSIDKNKLKFGYETMKVTSFDGKTMKTVDSTGMKQTFKKQ